MRVVIINGRTGCGKDTFVEMVNLYRKSINIHTSDKAKEALTLLGWNGVDRTPEVRDALAVLMQISRNLFDGVTKFIQERYKIHANFFDSDPYHFMFVHTREKWQIERLKKVFPDAVTLWVERDVEIPKSITNDSDLKVEEYQDYDFRLDNNGSLSRLKEEAFAFILNCERRQK